MLQRLFITMAVLLTATASAADREKLVVLPFAGSESSLVGIASEQLTTELAQYPRLDVVSSSDVAALLGLERQKQLLGCAEEASSCLTEISAALGAPWLVQGSLGRVGGLLRVDLKLLRSADGRALFREGRTLTSDDQLPSALAELSTSLLATLGYRPPSRGPVVLLVTGAAVAVAGAALVLIAFGQRQSLATPDQRGAVTFNQAVATEGLANTFSVLGWSLLGAGVGAAVVGLVWKLADVSPPVSVWVAPTPGGLVMGGAF